MVTACMAFVAFGALFCICSSLAMSLYRKQSDRELLVEDACELFVVGCFGVFLLVLADLFLVFDGSLLFFLFDLKRSRDTKNG